MGLEGRRPPESVLPERMPAKLDATPSRGVLQIFSVEEITAISLLGELPIDPSDDLAEPESLDLADDPPEMAAIAAAVVAAARPAQPRADPADAEDDAGQLEPVVLDTPQGERRLSGAGPMSAGRRSVVSHFSPEDFLALDKSNLQLDLPDDLWLYCLRFLDFKMQGVIPRLSKRFLGLSDCQEHWRNVAAHRGYTEGGRIRGEKTALAAGGWREYCKQQSRRELRWRTPDGCLMHVVPDCHQQWSPAIVYAPRSQEIVTCSYDGTVRTWLDDSARGGAYPCTRVLTTEEGEGFSVVTIAPDSVLSSPEGMLLAAGSEYGNLHVWCARAPHRAPRARPRRAPARRVRDAVARTADASLARARRAAPAARAGKSTTRRRGEWRTCRRRTTSCSRPRGRRPGASSPAATAASSRSTTWAA